MPDIASAEIVIAGEPFSETLRFLTESLGFRLDEIHPADDPSVARVSGHGLRLRLARHASAPPPMLRLLCRDVREAQSLVAPNGMHVELIPDDARCNMPPLAPSFVVTRMRGARWSEGRAGMRYRDLIPDRQGGRFVASHIAVGAGGEVADYVHHHAITFQLIYCLTGWVKVVYEDQGPPFVLEAGDCVLQPPHIRHRVLASGPGTEVVEIGSPAEHATRVDHAMTLPTGALRPERDFSGQRFVRHQARLAAWTSNARELGIARATGGRADARVVRGGARELAHDGELLFGYVLSGAATLDGDIPLGAGDAFVIPPRSPHALRAEPAAEVLEVRVNVSALPG